MMYDFEDLRNRMVDEQLIPRGIKDGRVLSVMRKVPRHLFVDEALQYRAYDDNAMAIGDGQTISQPYMVAAMTECLELKGNEKILEVGTGSGYQAAVLAELGGYVFTIERVTALAYRAEKLLNELGYFNVTVHVSNGTMGLEAESPFDRIIVTAGAPDIPEALVEQLAEGGILVIPVGDRYSQMLKTVKKRAGDVITTSLFPCVFVPLIGEDGWER
ncbi:MAG: protein-L-isoaspartate(D-aspartate) O-methyltransferase [Nitrospirae bacterium]|nr:protein-L-isoaspartate(D-aspartate) O-methyltransferase [Nitrospirota bacterium]